MSATQSSTNTICILCGGKTADPQTGRCLTCGKVSGPAALGHPVLDLPRQPRAWPSASYRSNGQAPTPPSGHAAPVEPRTFPGFRVRALTAEERARAFPGRGATGQDLEPYLIALRQMQLGTAYEMGVVGISLRAFKTRMNRAAKKLGKQLRWAPVSKGSPSTTRVLELKA